MTEPPTIDFRTRITVDIDHYVPSPRLKLLRAYNDLQRAGATEVKVAVSSGGTGYHVEGRFAEKMPDDAQERIRRTLADDHNRVFMDVERMGVGHTGNVFWYTKSTNDGVRQEFETPEDAMDYVSMTRKSDYDRARAMQLYGHKSVKDTSIPRPSLVESDE